MQEVHRKPITENGKAAIRAVYRQLSNINYGNTTNDFEADNIVEDIKQSVTMLQKYIVREIDKLKELEQKENDKF